jgi:hypothetical protein
MLELRQQLLRSYNRRSLRIGYLGFSLHEEVLECLPDQHGCRVVHMSLFTARLIAW